MKPEELDVIFFNVMEDINEYLSDLTLVGGWLPYIYSKYLWKLPIRRPVTTVDIDFGIDQTISGDYSKTIFEVLSSLDYRERHFKINRMFPVVFYKNNIPIEFITYPSVDTKVIEKILGMQIYVNKIEKFDFLLQHCIPIIIKNKNSSKVYRLNCPKPSAFLYHKGSTFIDRINKEKQAKDLYYMYFILRYSPNIDEILKEVSEYRKKGYLLDIVNNINNFFERNSSQGCLMIEKENGEDEYYYDVRQDIFERFENLKNIL